MEAIVPRWEWRTFAASFADADRRFRELPPGKVQESDELCQRYTVGGCMAEMTEVVADGRTTRSLAIELGDPARVWAPARMTSARLG